MLVAEDEDYEEYDEEDEKYDDEIWFDDMNQKILSFKHKVHKWLKEAEKSRSQRKYQDAARNQVQNILQNLVQNQALH